MSSIKYQIHSLSTRMRKSSQSVHTATWQSIDISKRPEAEMRELTDVFFRAEMPTDQLAFYREQIQPNLPWADDHFEQERVSGQPINPGTTWKSWPFGHSAEKFLDTNGVFSHSYAERYWPKEANFENQCGVPRDGIRFPYGDLLDMIRLLDKDPLTRQAYLPVWFPEDTGVAHGERVPCTLGYHFMMRDNHLNVFYPIRSCDFYRHFRDDIYLTIRLTLWILNQLRTLNPLWNVVHLGQFSMWVGSLHMFINDWRKLYG